MPRTPDAIDQENLKELLKSGDATAITLYYISRDITTLNTKFDELKDTFASQERVEVLEERLVKVEGNTVGQQRMQNAEKRVDDMEKAINKGVWIVLGAILLGLVNLLIQGSVKLP